MIISGRKILEEINEGRIVIDPFDPSMVGPNSCNLRLHDTLQVYSGGVLNMALPNPTYEVKIPRDGMMLKPGELYLGRTVEHTETDHFVPMIEGRSSVGRLGLFVHVTAGFGDVGFRGTWTLEMMVVKPTIIFPFVPVCQIYFHTIEGDVDLYRSNKYQDQTSIVASRLWKDITIVPPVAFFDKIEATYHGLRARIKDESGPLRFKVALHNYQLPVDKDILMKHVFEHVLADDGDEFPREVLVEFYSEVLRCFDTAQVTLCQGSTLLSEYVKV